MFINVYLYIKNVLNQVVKEVLVNQKLSVVYKISPKPGISTKQLKHLQ